LYQTDQQTAVATLPAPAAPGTQGFFTDGNPVAGEAATILDADFMNMVMMELINVVEAGGETPSKTTYNQVLEAILTLIGQPQNNQVSGVVGHVRNLLMSVTAASASATMTADEIIVESALGGLRYCLPSFSETINLATMGAGGMDTGTAPVSGYVGIYAIWNPTTSTAALLATNATSAKVGNVYGGAHMPSGYTASALVGVWPTNASGQFPIAYQLDREVFVSSVASGTFTTALTNAAVTLAVPLNAKTAAIAAQETTATAATSYQFAVGAASPVNGGLASMTQALTMSTAALTILITSGRVAMVTPQTVFVTWVVVGGSSPQLLIAISSYTF